MALLPTLPVTAWLEYDTEIYLEKLVPHAV